MKVNSYKIKSEEDLQRNVSTTPSFQKLQQKILNIQQKNDTQDQIQSSFSKSCNHKTASNSTDTSQYSCRDNFTHSEYSSCTNLDSQFNKKSQVYAKEQSYCSVREVSPLTQKLYDPPKLDQHQQQLKPPRYHTPTRDSIKSNDAVGQKQKTLTKTESKNSQKLGNQTSQKITNYSNSKRENSNKSNQINIESSPNIRKGSLSSQSKANKGKIEESNKKLKEGVTEKDKKIIEKIQKKLQNKSPISKSLKENRSNIKQFNDKHQIFSEQHLNQDQRLTRYENLLQKTPKNYEKAFEIKDCGAYLNCKSSSEEDNETNFQQNFLSNLKEKLNEENQLINEQLQKLDKKMIPNQKDIQKTALQSHLNISTKDLNCVNQYPPQTCIQSQSQIQHDLKQCQLDRLSSSNQDQKNNIFQNMNSTARKQSIPNLEVNKDKLNLEGFQEQLNRNNQIIGQIQHSSNLRLMDNKIFKNLSNSSSSESIKKQKLIISEQTKYTKQTNFDDLNKSPVAETRATSSKSTKYISNPLSYEKDLNNRFSTEDKSHDYANSTDEDLFSCYSLASRSNKNNTIQAKSNQLSANNLENIMHLYQPGEYCNKSNHNKENMILDQKKQNITDRDSSKSEQAAALCSTFRQCVNGNQEQINDLKCQIKQFQYENQQLKSLVQKQENQSFLNKKIISENKVQIQKIEQQNQQLIQKNKQLTDKLQKYEEALQFTKTESTKQQKEMQNKLQDRINQLQSALGNKSAEADQLRVDLSKIQQTVDLQIEKTNSQQIKIKNLEQLVSEYSKIESKLFELEDIHESVKMQNQSLQQQIEQCHQLEQKYYQILLEVKKSQQNQKSKVVEFSQVIDAYLKLTECIITEKEPSVDVLVGHRRKRSSFLEIKKPEDIQSLTIQLENDNMKQKIKEQSEIILTYIKGSSEKVQSVLDQSRSLLDKLSDYYMQKFGNGII
ncbi:hypothetical protein TTHERM_00592700 (macronuclear) [Tetrahymena thermophila SB210]|uniref:Uncharacterized protein n=1 Tax=Tetrahymena thermophila (strain SB210) TaxID=312017 RepID=Q232M8_TETTS|nr:hypothetical protein TTHERM_00592700 [Tetrahymena thermophila SB210]EAR91384.2 hypothetical protein TTHERM_00592700 [Tetrahymena thermophila SB210]|eukprot:XP_001011629.2 hypothetical protein TTHERM_00592700 [Tetrahymena thermophila SB210]